MASPLSVCLKVCACHFVQPRWLWKQLVTELQAASSVDTSVHYFLFGVVPGFSLEEAHLEEQNTWL